MGVSGGTIMSAGTARPCPTTRPCNGVSRSSRVCHGRPCPVPAGYESSSTRTRRLPWVSSAALSATPKAESTRWTSSISSSHKSYVAGVCRLTGAAHSASIIQPQDRRRIRPLLWSLLPTRLRSGAAEELQERESRLRIQLLEQKILGETVSIVPFLEKEIADKNDELARAGERIQRLEAEKRALHDEVEGLNSRLRGGEEACQRREKMVADPEAKLDQLRKVALEQGNRESWAWNVAEGEVDNKCSTSFRFQRLTDVTAWSNLRKNLRRSPKFADIASLNQSAQKSESGDAKADEAESERPHQHHQGYEKEEDFKHHLMQLLRSSSSSCSSSEIAIATSKGPELAVLPPIPPPATPNPLARPSPNAGVQPPPPPPPPLPPPPTRGSRSAASEASAGGG